MFSVGNKICLGANDNERQNILHNLKQPDCQYQLVFISSECVFTDSFQSCLDTLREEKWLKCLLLSRWGTLYGHLEQGLQTFLSAIRYFEKVWLAICLTYWYSNKTDIADNQYSTSDENCVVRLPCCRNNLCQFFESFAVLFHLLLILKCSCCSLLVYSLLWGSHICNLSQLMLLKTWPYQKKVL